jgi:hypothetical protein
MITRAQHLIRKGRRKNVYRDLVGKLKDRTAWLGIDGRIILKWTLRK